MEPVQAEPVTSRKASLGHSMDCIEEIDDDTGTHPQVQEDYVLVPDREVRIAKGLYPFPEVMTLPYKELVLLPNIAQSNVNGMVNVGVSCYFNVVMQAIVNSPGIKEYFLSRLYIKETMKEGFEDPELLSYHIPDTISNRIGEFVQLYHSYNDHVLNPVKLISLIKEKSKLFDPYQNQDDSHELLLYLLDKIATELNRYFQSLLSVKPVDKEKLGYKQDADKKATNDEAEVAPGTAGGHFGSDKQIDGRKPRVMIKKLSVVKGPRLGDKTLELASIPIPYAKEGFDAKQYVTIEAAPKYRSMDISRLSNTELLEKEAMEELSLKKWREYLKMNNSIISDVFMGQTLSKITCTHCHTSSYNFEPFYMLDLSFPPSTAKGSESRSSTGEQPEQVHTLPDLISHFGRADPQGDFQWMCPKCKIHRLAKKSSQIYKLPPVLIVCFKRFEIDMNTGTIKKNNDLVRINLQGEDLNSFEMGGNRGVRKLYTPYFFVVIII